MAKSTRTDTRDAVTADLYTHSAAEQSEEFLIVSGRPRLTGDESFSQYHAVENKNEKNRPSEM